MDWDDLRFVLALARANTLTRAASELGVTHTTVARRLRSLEDDLAVRVFDKTPDGYRLTAAGEDLCRVARRMEEEVHSLDRRVLGKDARLSGRLRVATLDVVARRDADLFAAFTRRYPGVELEITADDAFVDLTRREADVALRMTNRPPEHLVGRKIGRAEFALYASRELADRYEGRPYSAWPWLGWDERYRAPGTEAWMRKNAPEARIVCRVDSSLVMLGLLQAGVGLAFQPCIDGDAAPELVRVRPVEPGFGMDVWVLTHPDLRSTARIRAFMEHVGEAYAEMRPALAGELEAGA